MWEAVSLGGGEGNVPNVLFGRQSGTTIGRVPRCVITDPGVSRTAATLQVGCSPV